MAARADRLRKGRFVVFVVLIAGVGVATYLYLTRDALADPATADLPPQKAESMALRDYFLGLGAPLLVVLDQTSELPAEATTDACTQVAAGLDEAGSPDSILAVANGVPDPALRDATVNHLDAVADYLADCGTAETIAEQAERANFTSTVLNRMLIRAGAR